MSQNIQLCNGSDRTSLDSRIVGCTAFIDAGQGTPAASAIAYNNRGNAFVAKGTTSARSRISIDRSSSMEPTPSPSITAVWLT